MSTTIASNLGLVPQRRLGNLLSQRRIDHGYVVADMARLSASRFTELDLESIEAGEVSLDDGDIEALSLLFEFNSAPPRPQRSKLIIADDEDVVLPGGSDEFSAEMVHEVLVRYVALLYLLRNEPVGDPLPLRVDDLDTLAQAFSCTVESIVEDIEAIKLTDAALIADQVAHMRRRLVVPAAGLLVGPTPAGMLLLVK